MWEREWEIEEPFMIARTIRLKIVKPCYFGQLQQLIQGCTDCMPLSALELDRLPMTFPPLELMSFSYLPFFTQLFFSTKDSFVIRL